MKILKYIHFALVAIVVCSCAHKKYYKQGMKFESGGVYQSAVDCYFLSLEKKSNYIDAMVGLNRSGAHLIEEKEHQIEEAYNALNDDKVVHVYLDLENMLKRASKYNVSLSISERTLRQYKDSKERFLRVNYQKAEEMLEKELFGLAAEYLKEVISADPSYKNVQELYVIARAEPLYREIKTLTSIKKYRAAYYKAADVLAIDIDYKNTKELQQEALSLGVLTMNIKHDGTGKNSTLASNTSTLVGQLITKANNPFIQIVESDFYEKQLQDQKNAILNNQEYNQKIIPIRGRLTLITDRPVYLTAKPNIKQLKGFLKQTKSDKTVVWKKVYYDEIESSCSLVVRVGYQVSSGGKLILSDAVNLKKNDAIKYYSVTGDGVLYSGTWEKKTTPLTEGEDKVGSVVSFSGRRVLKPQRELEISAANEVANVISKKVLTIKID